ncbi:Hypp3436 [Branchiostoma lanceolatum]|uniref:Hypp3436 protein n=1 Tax=Branchiostoma lanceolatum TaxID=7740 RepID=A0A8J9ZZT1_BRALA|nr:Hypp3436 [Branchiostoma lanceolatum]
MLDVMMTRNPDNSITINVYRKETHTDQYLQWSSNHPVHHKLGIVRTLMHRADTLIEDPTLRAVEKEKVREALRHCGYPEWALKEGDNNTIYTEEHVGH